VKQRQARQDLKKQEFKVMFEFQALGLEWAYLMMVVADCEDYCVSHMIV
jgi:hypothetical protein